jgi:hypothetical protein
VPRSGRASRAAAEPKNTRSDASERSIAGWRERATARAKVSEVARKGAGKGTTLARGARPPFKFNLSRLMRPVQVRRDRHTTTWAATARRNRSLLRHLPSKKRRPAPQTRPNPRESDLRPRCPSPPPPPRGRSTPSSPGRNSARGARRDDLPEAPPRRGVDELATRPRPRTRSRRARTILTSRTRERGRGRAPGDGSSTDGARSDGAAANACTNARAFLFAIAEREA